MKRSKWLLLLFVLAGAVRLDAQVIRLSDHCNPLITSLKGVCYVVRQDYALIGKDGVSYGKNNQSFFGYGYGPAVVWNNQLWFSPSTYYIHQRDSSAGSYGADFVPKSTTTYFKRPEQQVFTPIVLGESAVTPVRVKVDMADSVSGFNPEKPGTPVQRKTMVVTFECRDEVYTDTSRFQLGYLYTEVIKEPDGNVSLSAKKLGNNTRFGLVFDEVTETGRVHLEFRGFVEYINGKMVLSLMAEEDLVIKDTGKTKRK